MWRESCDVSVVLGAYWGSFPTNRFADRGRGYASQAHLHELSCKCPLIFILLEFQEVKMDQAVIDADVPTAAHGKFSEAELQMLRYQLEEAEFAKLIRLVSSLPSEKWDQAIKALSAL
jgi:hypothetical protein